MPEPPRSPYAVRPMVVLELVAVAMIAIGLLAVLAVRERVARLPEIGRAAPIEELRSAWAEAEREQAGPRVSPITMPHPRPRPESGR